MSRYNVTYEKKYTLISGTKWHCTIYDRKSGNSHYGEGETKADAKSDAWDSVWGVNSSSSSSNEPSVSNEERQKNIKDDLRFSLIGLLVSGAILGWGFYVIGIPGQILRLLGIISCIIFFISFLNAASRS